MDSEAPSADRTARGLLRLAATASLATVGADGAPFASLVTVATTVAGEPLLLLSTLAVHTRNLDRDPRAALLLAAMDRGDDPLAGSRLTVSGRIGRDEDPASRRRFLARHDEARGYADFDDFAIYRLAVSSGHLVAGFGRIVGLGREALLSDLADAHGLVEAEEAAVAHMNVDHAEAIALYATRLLGRPEGAWRMTGIDPEGADLRAGPLRARLEFDGRVTTAAALRQALVAFAGEARRRAV